MVDVFGGLAGGPADDGQDDRPSVDPTVAERFLAGAALWGAEIDTRYRVLALTFEPTPDRYPGGDVPDDRRLQVLCHPVSTILASLRRTADEGPELLEFTEEHLVDVAAAFGGAVPRGMFFGHAEPRPGEWGPRFSLQGRSSAPDGTAATITLEVAQDDLTLDLFARFDVLELRTPDGRSLEPA